MKKHFFDVHFWLFMASLLIGFAAAAQAPRLDSLTRWPVSEVINNSFINYVPFYPQLSRCPDKSLLARPYRFYLPSPADGSTQAMLIPLQSLASPLTDSVFGVRCFVQIRDSVFEFPVHTLAQPQLPTYLVGWPWYAKMPRSALIDHEFTLPVWYVVEGERAVVVRRAAMLDLDHLDAGRWKLYPRYGPLASHGGLD